MTQCLAEFIFILYFDLTTIWHIQSSLSCVEYVYFFTKSLIDMSFQPLGTKHCFSGKEEKKHVVYDLLNKNDVERNKYS
jgi:hypothetical protein